MSKWPIAPKFRRNDEVGEEFGLVFGSRYPRCHKCGEDIYPGMESPLRDVCDTCYAVEDMGRFVEVLPGSPEPKRKTNEEE